MGAATVWQAYRGFAVWKRAPQVQGSRPFTDCVGHIPLPAGLAEVVTAQRCMHALPREAVKTNLAGDLHDKDLLEH